MQPFDGRAMAQVIPRVPHHSRCLHKARPGLCFVPPYLPAGSWRTAPHLVSPVCSTLLTLSHSPPGASVQLTEQSCGSRLETLVVSPIPSCSTQFGRPSELSADGGSLSECLMSLMGDKWSSFYFGSSQFLGWLREKSPALLISASSKIRI